MMQRTLLLATLGLAALVGCNSQQGGSGPVGATPAQMNTAFRSPEAVAQQNERQLQLDAINAQVGANNRLFTQQTGRALPGQPATAAAAQTSGEIRNINIDLPLVEVNIPVGDGNPQTTQPPKTNP
jgi:hypothetical protein